MGTVIQDGGSEGEIPVLTDSRSVAEAMPVSMATELGPLLQAVDPDKYKLKPYCCAIQVKLHFRDFTLKIFQVNVSYVFQTHCPLKTLSCHGGPCYSWQC